ncbi:oxidoreductase [Breznakia pachnodae]|uniref:2,4-dienoyl-CoA reductase-like NADH-dependent reductase (Old Yellow Enzyme family)/thioredoxin reductase n=1 Tax=Breznakia pachnodae TaxID=265178 RepID=A0ABU0E0Y7_9FIRM|nr:FAD-dependent oxidoreductase [Breznakia pachnodae]MDQ0360215.1 2,4-dienoyl-CoA reductase-like NADH-dependent reductase (Old Yellow Enzyme family)/thioredoxin reductase [Breznakia pachnodae]
MKNNYPNLFKPLRMRNVIFQNRVFVSSMGCPPTHKHPSSPKYDAGVGFYDKTAGGAAAILVEVPPTQKDGTYPKYERDVIRELMSLAGQSGSKIGAGLGLFGRDEDGTMYGPSSYKKPDGTQLQEVTEEKMLSFIEELGRNAKAAKEFGFDYVQYHMAHESIMSHFLAPGFNQRKDEYGGSLENRMKFPKLAIKTIREAVGNDMPIIVRLSAYLHCDESFEFEEMLTFIKEVQNEIDMVNVSCGMDTWYETNVYHCTTPFQPHNINAHWAAKIKKVCPDLYVCPVGGIVTPEDAEEIITSNQADAVMLGRAMNADPLWPKKAKEGRSEDIVPCLRCSYCYHAANDHNLIACSVNPRFFRENRVPMVLDKAGRIKKVVVIGGGPAGCKAAITASERGHHVVLIEKSDKVGGQLKHADLDEHKSDLARYCKYLQVQIAKSEVTVLYNTTATPEVVKSLEPDAVIIAIGATPVKPNIKGIDKPLVMEAIDSYNYMDMIGHNVSIIGGGTIGSEMALKLAEDGHKVSIIESGDKLCARGHMLYRIGIRHAMDKVSEKITSYLNTSCMEILDDRVIIEKDGKQETIVADTVLVSVGLRPLTDKVASFYGITPETYYVGDCDRVGKVLEATNNAYFIAVNL